MKLQNYYLTSMLGIALCLSTETLTMDPPEQIGDKKCLHSLSEDEITSPFSYLAALRMEYKDYSKEKCDAFLQEGIRAKMAKNFPLAINAFLEAVRYRHIPAMKWLAQTYKDAGQYMDAFKWMMWAGQESTLQDVAFEFPPNFCDAPFKIFIDEFGRKGIIEGKKVRRQYHKFLLSWSNTIKVCGRVKNELFWKEVLEKSYDNFPSILEPYLSKEEYLAKQYLFKSVIGLTPLLGEILAGKTVSRGMFNRVLSACIAKKDTLSLYYTGILYLHNNDTLNAEVYLLKASHEGLCEALYSLGQLYKRLGRDKESFGFIHEAAQNGFAGAQSELGYLYLKGIGTEVNMPEALNWFIKADKQGDVTGTYNVGSCYLNGNGVEKNYEKAKEFLDKAANLGDATALNDLAYMYGLGLGVSKSEEIATDYYRRAVEGGEPLALEGYACVLFKKKNSEAFKYFLKAYDIGSVGSEFFLGVCYIEGIGTKLDKQKGFDLAKRGIEKLLIEKDYTNSETRNRLFYLIKLHYNLMLSKNHIYDDDFVRAEIQTLKGLLGPLATEKGDVVDMYYQAYFDYYEGNYESALELFSQTYLYGVQESKEMIKCIFEYLNQHYTATEIMSSTDSLEETSGDDILIQSNQDLSDTPEGDDELIDESPKKVVKENRELRDQRITEARASKERKIIQQELKAREKLHRRVADISADRSMEAIEIGVPMQIEYIFEGSAAGKAVSQKFFEMKEDPNSKLNDVLNDIQYGYKTNNVHPLTGPLKGYFARNMNHCDRLVYRWIGPGQLEIRSCETHYGD